MHNYYYHDYGNHNMFYDYGTATYYKTMTLKIICTCNSIENHMHYQINIGT